MRKYDLYSCRKGSKKVLLTIGNMQGNMKLFRAKMKVNTYTICEIGLSTEEEGKEEEEEERRRRKKRKKLGFG